jgi:hypothetical protein
MNPINKRTTTNCSLNKKKSLYKDRCNEKKHAGRISRDLPIIISSDLPNQECRDDIEERDDDDIDRTGCGKEIDAGDCEIEQRWFWVDIINIWSQAGEDHLCHIMKPFSIHASPCICCIVGKDKHQAGDNCRN